MNDTTITKFVWARCIKILTYRSPIFASRMREVLTFESRTFESLFDGWTTLCFCSVSIKTLRQNLRSVCCHLLSSSTQDNVATFCCACNTRVHIVMFGHWNVSSLYSTDVEFYNSCKWNKHRHNKIIRGRKLFLHCHQQVWKWREKLHRHLYRWDIFLFIYCLL